MAIYLDIAIIVILIVTCIVGYVRGFRKYFIGMVAVVIAVVAGAYISGELAEPVYDRYMREKVKTHVTEAIEDYDPKEVVMEKLREQGYGDYISESEVGEIVARGGDYLENVSELLRQKGAGSEEVAQVKQNIDGYFKSELPDQINRRLEETGLAPYVEKVNISADELRECVTRAAAQSKEDAADYIVEKAIKPVLVGIIRSLLFAICFLAVILLLRIIIAISGVMDSIPEARAADRFAGLVLGAIKGLLYCAVIAWALSTLCNATKNSMSFFNADISEKTFLFRYFFDFFYK
ncbi:CvpA family protein [Ruminococcus sp.]|uniref:CvpA family protein n=1 Tax=Ruminococcus sp. TaxID=41978 RepID=UPI0025F06854|nr:CvpA family protein [Ruminococcus sp.]MBQ8965624.1 CvpA family protein [Ruminococcus sp.]